MEFSMDVKDRGPAIEIVVRGDIDETSQLVAPRTGGKQVVIDGADVRRINSMGVSAWCRFLDELTRQGPVTLKRLSALLVMQASMITSFTGTAKVESFFSPWVCPSCEHEHSELHGGRDQLPASLPCPKCGAAMELDTIPAAFLAFREN
jgi:hypothetical protein